MMDDIEDTNKFTRIAIIDKKKCKPKKCNLECKKICPVNNSGQKKICVEVTKESAHATIGENLCIGCNACVNVCPFGAIKIVKVPTNIGSEIIHRFGPNTFKLHRLPAPRKGKIVGIVGSNGLGKSTILNILSDKITINFGNYNSPPEKKKIIEYFRGSELQEFFSMEKKVVTKPQFIDAIPKIVAKNNGKTNEEFATEGKCGSTVGEYLLKYGTAEKINEAIERFGLKHLDGRDLNHLSGGELQRFACVIVFIMQADVYMFDEFTSFLDIKQRLSIANSITELCENNKYVVIVEHDLSILDYLSDYISILFGEPSVYGIVSSQFSSNNGINIYLNGYIPADNMRFRPEPFVYENKMMIDSLTDLCHYKYPSMKKSFDGFELEIDQGEFTTSSITVLLGENGVGKTTFINLLFGIIEPTFVDDDKLFYLIKQLSVSYKPQDINSGKNDKIVSDLIGNKLGDSTFVSQIIKPLNIDKLYDKQLSTLSGGELQKVMITLCLCKEANIYLMDEPSAFLDCESRITVSKILKRYFVNNKKIAFIVEHDLLMITYLADKIINFEGKPGISTKARSPTTLTHGMNYFLRDLDITLRKDPVNNRTKINKKDSMKDREQKKSGKYYDI